MIGEEVLEHQTRAANQYLFPIINLFFRTPASAPQQYYYLGSTLQSHHENFTATIIIRGQHNFSHFEFIEAIRITVAN